MLVPISIVMTTYNRQQFLGAAIASILSQTWRDFELVIWDDGSTDGSLEVIQNAVRGERRVQIVAAPHQGRVPALRNAIAQTSGIYLGWVDSDDVLAPTALEETIAVLQAHPEIGFVYTDHVLIDETDQSIGDGQGSQVAYSADELLFGMITFHFRLIRRSVFDQVGGIDASLLYAEDYDLCLRLSEVTDVYHLQRSLYYYRRHLQNMTVQEHQEINAASQEAIARALRRRGLMDQLPAGIPIHLALQQWKGAMHSAARRVSWLLGV